MPLFMDEYRKVDGLAAQAVAEAHRKDLEMQGRFGVTYQRYWFDEDSGKVFCLVEAPTEQAAAEVHRQAHGLLADEITPVHEGT